MKNRWIYVEYAIAQDTNPLADYPLLGFYGELNHPIIKPTNHSSPIVFVSELISKVQKEWTFTGIIKYYGISPEQLNQALDYAKDFEMIKD